MAARITASRSRTWPGRRSGKLPAGQRRRRQALVSGSRSAHDVSTKSASVTEVPRNEDDKRHLLHRLPREEDPPALLPRRDRLAEAELTGSRISHDGRASAQPLAASARLR